MIHYPKLCLFLWEGLFFRFMGLIFRMICCIIIMDTLNKSGFRRKKSWIYGIFSAKTTLNQCFLIYGNVKG